MIDSEYFCHYVEWYDYCYEKSLRLFPREVLKGWFGCVCVFVCVWWGWGGGGGWILGGCGGNVEAFKSWPCFRQNLFISVPYCLRQMRPFLILFLIFFISIIWNQWALYSVTITGHTTHVRKQCSPCSKHPFHVLCNQPQRNEVKCVMHVECVCFALKTKLFDLFVPFFLWLFLMCSSHNMHTKICFYIGCCDRIIFVLAFRFLLLVRWFNPPWCTGGSCPIPQ